MISGNIYRCQPKSYIQSIPVFSDLENDYIRNYERIAKDHIKAYEAGIQNPFIEERLWDALEDSTLKLIMKYLPNLSNANEINILDVGVGMGRLIDKIRSNLNHDMRIAFYGIDIALPYLLIAKAKGIEVALSSVEDIPYISNCFDMVICTDVLEHVFDLNLALSKIVNVLKDGCYLVIRVPNKEDLSSYLRADYPYKYAHLRNFDSSSLQILLTKICKLEVIEIIGDVFIPSESLIKCKLSYTITIWTGRIIKALKQLLRPNLYNKILSVLYEPLELNCVARKNSHDVK